MCLTTGVVVGSFEDNCGSERGGIWENGLFRSLRTECQLIGVDGGSTLRAIAVTPGGRHIIVGSCDGAGGGPAVFYDDGRGNYTAELLLLLAGDSEGEALDVNASGQVVGWTRAAGPVPGPAHAVRWDFTIPNVAPTAQAGSLTTPEDTAASGILAATDIDDVNLAYHIVSNGTRGAAVITNPATGAFTYTPNPNANGFDTFTFAASDGALDSAPAAIDVTITAVNDAPVSSNGTAATNATSPVSGTLVANDIDSAALTYSIVANGIKGSAVVTNPGTGAFTYSPAPGPAAPTCSRSRRRMDRPIRTSPWSPLRSPIRVRAM